MEEHEEKGCAPQNIQGQAGKYIGKLLKKKDGKKSPVPNLHVLPQILQLAAVKLYICVS